MAGSLNTINLAIYQEKYYIKETKETWVGATIERDYIYETAWKKNADLTYSSYQTPVYHVICPLNTYFQKYKCYGQPIELSIPAVMPYMTTAGKLAFELTSKYSSVVDVELLDVLVHQWRSDDAVLNKKLTDSGSSNSVKLTTDDLLMEKTYPI